MVGKQQKPQIQYYEVACQQVLERGHAVFSIQWAVIPALHVPDLTPDKLLRRYLAYINSFTLSLVRPVETPDSVEFRLLATTIPLLKFSPPVQGVTPNGTRTTLRISGGILVQPKQCDRGELDFLVEQHADGVKLTLQLSDYCPLLLGSPQPSIWRKWLYRLTQAYIHKVVTVRFLSRVYREIEGKPPMVKVVKATLRQGEDT
jgi:hypothetical protein